MIRAIERKGPKANLAYLNGCPTNAALGFANSLDIDVGELEIKNTEKAFMERMHSLRL